MLRNVRDLLLVPLSNTPEERMIVLPCSLVDVWTVFTFSLKGANCRFVSGIFHGSR